MRGTGLSIQHNRHMAYFSNPFRLLGVCANEPMDAARLGQLVAERGIACDCTGTDPMARIMAHDRTAEALSAAGVALASVPARLAARLMWFTADSDQDRAALAAINRGRFPAAVDIWEAEPGARAKANLARLLHSLALAGSSSDDDIRFGPIGQSAGIWGRAIAAWAVAINSDEFWEQFALDDAHSRLTPAAGMGDVRSFRAQAWLPVLEPSRDLLAALVEAGEYGQARDHNDDLAGAGAPRKHVRSIVMEAFAPVLIDLDTVIAPIREELGRAPSRSLEPAIELARTAFRRNVQPKLHELESLTGPDFPPTRAAFDKGAALLETIVEAAVVSGDQQLANTLQAEANRLGRAALAARPTQQDRVPVKRTAKQKKREKIIGFTMVGLVIAMMTISTMIDNNKESTWSGYRDDGATIPPDVAEHVPMRDSELDTVEESVGVNRPIEDRIHLVTAKEVVLGQLEDSIDYDANYLEKLADTLDRQLTKLESLRTGTADSGVQEAALVQARRVWGDLCRKTWGRYDALFGEYRKMMARYNGGVKSLDAVQREEAELGIMTPRAGIVDAHDDLRTRVGRARIR